MSVDFMKISELLIEGEAKALGLLVAQALEEGNSPDVILQKGLIAGMDEVGKRFKASEMFVPEVLRSARAMHAGMDILKPILAATNEGESKEKIVIGTVKGDLHDIGKNLVSMLLEGAGFEVIDAGIDISPEGFLEIVKKEKPAIVGMSAMLSTTMQAMGDTINYFKEQGMRDEVKFIVGGAPVSQEFANTIGADGYGDDATDTLSLVKKILGKG